MSAVWRAPYSKYRLCLYATPVHCKDPRRTLERPLETSPQRARYESKYGLTDTIPFDRFRAQKAKALKCAR